MRKFDISLVKDKIEKRIEKTSDEVELEKAERNE
jgi:hypothetical protein